MPELAIDPKKLYQAEILSNRLAKRYRHLRKWAKRVGTTAWRLYDDDIPEIPLVLDVYGDYIAGALYERPYEKAPEEEKIWLELMTLAISRSLGWPESSIFLRERKRLIGQDQYERLATTGIDTIVTEGGLRFTVNLSDYLDTGLFIDHRKTRSMIREAACARRILNLFSYTAAFSVYAASGGAESTDSVDLSNTYLNRARANFALNGFSSENIDPRAFIASVQSDQRLSDRNSGEKLPAASRNRLIRADAIRFLEEAINARLTWDLIVLDPPTFSNSKKMAGTLDIRRDHRNLIEFCLKVLAPGGTLWFSTNARSFNLDQANWPNFHVRDMKEATRDMDFEGHRLRACYTFNRKP